MPTPFAPSTLDEFAVLLEHRRQSSAKIAASLRTGSTYALEDRDLSDLLDSDAPDGGSNDADRADALALARLASLRALPETPACVTGTTSRGRILALVG